MGCKFSFIKNQVRNSLAADFAHQSYVSYINACNLMNFTWLWVWNQKYATFILWELLCYKKRIVSSIAMFSQLPKSCRPSFCDWKHVDGSINWQLLCTKLGYVWLATSIWPLLLLIEYQTLRKKTRIVFSCFDHWSVHSITQTDEYPSVYPSIRLSV